MLSLSTILNIIVYYFPIQVGIHIEFIILTQGEIVMDNGCYNGLVAVRTSNVHLIALRFTYHEINLGRH